MRAVFDSYLKRFSCGLLLLASVGGCSAEVSDDGTDPELGAELAALDVDPLALAFGRRQTLVDGITGAENLLFTHDDRLLVSADAGIFEIARDGRGGYQARALLTGAPCSASGMVERAGVVYAGCYDFTDSHLYAARLEATTVFRKIADLPGIVLANGWAGDDAGNLYAAATLNGQILRLHVSAADPFAIDAQDVWLADAGLFANGLELRGGTMYWTDFGTIKSAALRSDGRPGRVRTLVNDLAFYDDLFVDDQSIAVASVLGGSVHVYDLRGTRTGSIRAGALDGPSAVLPTNGRLGLPTGALVISERNANRVSLFIP